MSHPTRASEKSLTGKRPASFDLDALIKDLNASGKKIKKEDISLTPDPKIETQERINEFTEIAKQIIKSQRKNNKISLDNPAINSLSKAIIKNRLSK